MDECMKELDKDLEQLMLLKEMTRTTGVLHEAQVVQLRYYPLMATHAIKSEFIFKYDKSELIFDIKETKGRKPADWDKRLEILSQYTQMLLGTEYTVKVKMKGKQVFIKRGNNNGRRDRKQVSTKRGAEPRRLEKI